VDALKALTVLCAVALLAGCAQRAPAPGTAAYYLQRQRAPVALGPRSTPATYRAERDAEHERQERRRYERESLRELRAIRRELERRGD